MTSSTQYDPDVGRPKKQPGEHYRTPARSWKPPPALYAEFKAKTTEDGIDMTGILVWGMGQYLADKVPPEEIERLREEKRGGRR